MVPSETKKCTKCQQVLPVAAFALTLSMGRYRPRASCRECSNKQTRDWYRRDDIREWRREKARTLEGRYLGLKTKAKARKQELTLSLAQYKELNSQPCHYCQGTLPEAGSGLDRLDNSKGYSLDNVVPCCGVCNVMKSTFWSAAEFKEIGEIVRRLRERKEAQSILG